MMTNYQYIRLAKIGVNPDTGRTEEIDFNILELSENFEILTECVYVQYIKHLMMNFENYPFTCSGK